MGGSHSKEACTQRSPLEGTQEMWARSQAVPKAGGSGRQKAGKEEMAREELETTSPCPVPWGLPQTGAIKRR